MDLKKRVWTARRELWRRANERWREGQPALGAARPPRAARKAKAPRLAVGEISPEQRLNFSERQRLRDVFDSTAYRNLRIAAERQIGATLDFADLPPDEQARKAGRPVARIVTLPGKGLVPQGIATCFLVAPDLVLTNHHVFRTADEARATGIQFLHEQTAVGLQEGVTFELDPARFFVNDKRFDYAVVAVKHTAVGGTPLSDFRYLPLIGVTGKIRKGDPVNIIQYPGGEKKEYVTTNNRLLDLREDGFMLYEADTAEGSSGSPVFNRSWETVGLHHSAVPRMEDGKLVTKDGRRVPLDADVQDTDLIWVANEGVRVSAIVASLEQQKPSGAEQQRILRNLLACARDPVRLVVEESPIVTGGEGAASATTPASGTRDPAWGAMARNQFTFTGPVTIQVGRAAAGAAGLGNATDEDTPLEIRLASEFSEKKLKFDEDYADRARYGYKAAFLDGWRIPAPTLNKTHHGAPLLTPGRKVWVIPYHHYSLVMNRDRRLLSWAASNVDYGAAARKHTKNRDEYGGEDWRLDPRVALAAPGLQIVDLDFYGPATKIDCGHVVRREDGAWGTSAQEAEYGNSDTYHWTNCTPQSYAFNRSNKHGIWGQFENHIQTQVAANGGRMVVFAGPVLNPDDPKHGYAGKASIQVPMEFWKVAMCVGKEGGKRVRLAYGFVFDQTRPIQEKGFERMDMTDFAIYQMPLAEITRKTGVVFPKSVLAADVLKTSGAPESVRGFAAKRIAALEEIVLR